MREDRREYFSRIFVPTDVEKRTSDLTTGGHLSRLFGESQDRTLRPKWIERSSKLLVPEGYQQETDPIHYATTYVTSEEYLDFDPADIIEHCLRDIARNDLLAALSTLDRITYDPNWMDDWTNEFRIRIRPEYRERLDAALAPGTGRTAAIMSRQQILNSVKAVLTGGNRHAPSSGQHPLVVATILVHAISSASYRARRQESGELSGAPADLAMEIICNQAFNSQQDYYASIDRHVRMWREIGDNVRHHSITKHPTELLQEATGLELEDILALGFALWAKAMEWTPQQTSSIPVRFVDSVDSSQIDMFLNMVSANDETLSANVANSNSTWDFLPLQHTPAVRYSTSLLALDMNMILDRVLFALYWDVANFVKSPRGLEFLGFSDPDKAFTAWTDLYAHMVEEIAELAIRELSISIVGHDDHATYFTEEDLGNATSGKRCDAGLDYGSHFILFEVVSGRLTTKSSSFGSLESFKNDVERLIVDKAEQLNDTAIFLLSSGLGKPGFEFRPDRRILPVLVTSSFFPQTQLTGNYIDERLQQRSFLADPRIEKLALIEVGELELLEALCEDGNSLLDMLLGWKSSNLASLPLTIYLMDRFASGKLFWFRPKRVKMSTPARMQEICTRLGFPSETCAKFTLAG